MWARGGHSTAKAMSGLADKMHVSFSFYGSRYLTFNLSYLYLGRELEKFIDVNYQCTVGSNYVIKNVLFVQCGGEEYRINSL